MTTNVVGANLMDSEIPSNIEKLFEIDYTGKQRNRRCQNSYYSLTKQITTLANIINQINNTTEVHQINHICGTNPCIQPINIVVNFKNKFTKM